MGQGPRHKRYLSKSYLSKSQTHSRDYPTERDGDTSHKRVDTRRTRQKQTPAKRRKAESRADQPHGMAIR